MRSIFPLPWQTPRRQEHLKILWIVIINPSSIFIFFLEPVSPFNSDEYTCFSSRWVAWQFENYFKGISKNTGLMKLLETHQFSCYWFGTIGLRDNFRFRRRHFFTFIGLRFHRQRWRHIFGFCRGRWWIFNLTLLLFFTPSFSVK